MPSPMTLINILKYVYTLGLNVLLYEARKTQSQVALLSQRGRAMLCLSIHRAQSSVISYFRFIFTAANN